MGNGIMRFRTNRRTFLQGAGGGILLAASGLARPQQPAAASETYQLTNGYVSLSGAHGKLTQFACDPSGAGKFEPSTFKSVFVGATDFFDSRFNADVSYTATDTKLSITGIQLPSASTVKQDQVGSPVPLSTGHTLGQSFTASMYRFSKVGAQLPTWSSQNSTVTMTLYSGTPDTALTEITRREINPVQDNGWAYLDVPAQPAGTYYMELSDSTGTPGWWSKLGETTVDLGGAAYSDRQVQADRTMTLDVVGFNVDGIATWDLELDGSAVTSTYDIEWQTDARPDPGLTLNTSWVKDGYSIADADGIRFSRFYGDAGDYMPSEQLKRRDAWTTPVSGEGSVTATGSGPYDLRFTGDSPVIDGTMTAKAMALALNSGSAEPGQAISRTIAVDIKAHSDALPEIFPVFTASDSTRAAQLSTFYWERALSYRFDGHAMAWADWEGRILDWTGTAGAAAQADSLLGTSLDEDGYVWSWPDSQGWPFPDPELFDARHFTSNALYVLGAWRYYSWTGDSDFLSTMMPRVRRAIDFYIDSLDGKKGVVTITSPDHDGRDGALPSNYWDVTSFGYKDAYLNAYFYGALEAVAQLEEHSGQRGRAARLRALRKLVKKKYNTTFWNDADGRYVQTIDVDGVVHDYGSTYVNLEAASFGLPTDDMATRIFDWLDNGHTELQEPVVLIESGGLAPMIDPGHSLGQSFTADAAFTSVAARFPTFGNRGATFTMTLHKGLPGESATKVADQQFSDWSDGRVAHIDVDSQEPGVYYLEVSDVTGSLAWWSSATPVYGAIAYADGAPDANASTRFIVALDDHVEGPADIYSKWVFAPRSTTRRNSYWFFLTHLTTPWGDEVQDGGAILYTSGFDVMARARYQSADDAWARMTAILDRWSEPDHLCGGAPLFRGESTVDGATAGSSVGTDVPFPESGLVPASFLYAFVGVEAEPDSLVITPNLPSGLTNAGVKQLRWRGKQLNIVATHNTVTVTGNGVSFEETYTTGKSVRLAASSL
ncbi:MGH1-like glycoside hydrolase domain-containing protein [Paramicrobacterium fandaimingii]|uniref:MGH1-like glycoside hydrolase domain-containing protein n=1 Tax=Paramicrobacterium fandaimingii TaxID=2708079 RepID=UPI001422A33D|nr:GH116 family glycosyl hydrolase [Microbacterium fandaimingii]